MTDAADTTTRISQPALGWAKDTPDAPALVEGERRWSYREFGAAIEEAAALLRTLDVRPGDRVMLIGENGLALAAFILAVAHIDACAVLENARRAALEVDGIRAHCDPRMVVYLVGNSPDAAAHAARHGAVARDLARIGHVAHSPAARSSAPDPVAGSQADVAVLIYTTGTTGRPKGVMLKHASLLYLSRMMVALRGLSTRDRIYGVLPITHVMGLASVFGGALRAGAELRLVPRFDVDDCIAALARDGITALQGAPAMFAKLVDTARRRPVVAPQLRFIGAGGAPIDPTVKAETEALFGLTLQNGYGLTEAASLTWTRLDQPRCDCSVGLPLPGVELRVLAPDGQPVAPGAIGELWGRGPNVMKGYYRNPEQTAKVLRDDGWFNTEDLARIDADGHVHIEGRTKELIIASGFNVYPLEVENALNAHPAVVHSAVVGRAADGGNESVIAFIELAAGAVLTLAELNAFLAERISPYKRPREVYAMAALPASPNGKVLKSRLKDLAQRGDLTDATRLR
jgi:acyl-CoA synthetase (AMP-forming)/AMP-acid ligase II